MIAPEDYPLLRHAELVREAELDAENRRHPDRIIRRRTVHPRGRRRTRRTRRPR